MRLTWKAHRCFSLNVCSLSVSLLSSGFLRLLEAAEVAADPVHPESRPESRRGHPLFGADLAQPAGQDRRVGEPDPGHGHGLHPGTIHRRSLLLFALGHSSASLPTSPWRSFYILPASSLPPIVQILRSESINQLIIRLRNWQFFSFVPQSIQLFWKTSWISQQRFPSGCEMRMTGQCLLVIILVD